ncbi:retron Ec67 family RNA-directed DNA polymerase/endonuclease [Caballeronia sp. GAOx1]|uniref:retron Ec67 family RNA-directed DNA polymerase/endonuclease n=1 Tax=Caballeronia sp. GAOx1 TaxID=2921761 RepID=UPI0020287AA4|nr:retron Ec67 family RNA-directed DNA polymerase/endonuclease [Caballeronia sp. GAOx1]
MSQLTQLKTAKTIYDVAALLDYKASAIAYILYKKAGAAKYRSFTIPKKGGGERCIDMPSDDLKQLQRRLSDLLQNCQQEIRSATGRVDDVSHGFARNRSIVTNARAHRGRKHVFNVDLQDFFGTINFGRVRGFFIADRDFRLDSKVATIIAQIACYDNRLPQGSPCSPVISNLIGHILDVHLVRLAQQQGVRYSRYADDLSFSTNLTTFPPSIAERLPTGEWAPGDELSRLLALSGFAINPSKTRMQYRTSRQEVTGLVVNQKVNVSSDYRRTVRAMVHRLFTTGAFEVDGAAGTISQLHGMLGFVDGIDVYNRQLRKAWQGVRELSAKEATYRNFLLYKEFFASPVPVIICEGKTDNIYLKLAINALGNAYPRLASVAPDGKITRNVRIYRYADTSTGRILDITGGTPHLAKLIRIYAQESKRFLTPVNQCPFIFLVDNDSGATSKGGIFPAVVNATNGRVKVDRSKPYTHVTANLFVAPTPLLPGALDSQMEDFFDAATKAVVLNGKTFDPKNEFDTAISYGKHIFAQKVVLANAGKVDFSGFSAILQTLSDIVEL